MAADRWLLLLMLAANALWDLYRREILLFPTLLYGAYSLGGLLLSGEPVSRIAASCIPGMFLLGLALATDRKVGMGDVWILLAVGIRLGFAETLEILWIAVILLAVLCLILAAAGKITKEKGTELPMVPFVAAAVLIRQGLSGSIF